MKTQKKLLLTTAFLGILIWVIFNLQPPSSLNEPSLIQILGLFLPLFLFLFFCFTFFISRVKSFFLTVCFVVILYCLGVRLINYLGAGVTLIICFTLINPPQINLTEKFKNIFKSKTSNPPQEIQRGLRRIKRS